jgi:hypothetical protein
MRAVLVNRLAHIDLKPMCIWPGCLDSNIGKAENSGSCIMENITKNFTADVMIAATRGFPELLQRDFICLPLSPFEVESRELEPM